MKIHLGCSTFSVVAFLLPLMPSNSTAQSVPPQPVVISAGWQLQDLAKAPQSGAEVSVSGFKTDGWYNAAVPGTVLTTLANNHVYPEPLYGENNRPEVIPESLSHTSYWYRTLINIPKSYKGHHVWLNFDGINYSSIIWVNGIQVGKTRGAFIRGIFDITPHVKPGTQAVVAVLVAPQPHPGIPHEHTLRDGMGPNGGITAMDGPTFLSTIGWDWIPAIRDRDTGIWQKVFLSASGPVLVKNPLVTTDLPLPRTDSSDVAVQATIENITDGAQKAVIQGSIESLEFRQEVVLAPHSNQLVIFDSKSTPALHIENPRLWWPNGYGPQNLYHLHLSVIIKHDVSDVQDVDFGVRKITYSVPGSDTLTLSVNGVQVFIRGGDWGLDEAMKRISRERLEAQIKMHQLANLNMIRNWVGQSTGEDFYELCDKYGILVWDEFFQPNPDDGPNPNDIPTYIANVRDKILRFRNHPSIALWCARNEGYPPPEVDAALRKLMAELEPTRRYQPSSTDGAGVRSHGPYAWRTPREFYIVTDDFFKTETGSVSVPTLESIHGMMPKKDWESINDDWAEHDFAKGNSGAQNYPDEIAARYGKFRNLADFVRKAQLANYEAFRAMYEGRNALLFHPTTAILTWMSNPAQPSFVWQIYHYDFEPNASFFGVMHASELVHIQFNQATDHLQVINNL
ncbi:MAG TPA: glycoside hydrolase family 2 TIM barrel-domain containing protein, partial [Terracidiphilus sp.]|nr:glycoside hydrolase family 2 TIM barrel-domain containing protein [Terracidiphilus sp.]